MFDRSHTKDFSFFREFAPDWMTNEAIHTLRSGYLLSDESPLQFYKRLARAAASYYPDGLKGLTQYQLECAFFFAFIQGWLSPATPIACNLGAGDTGLVSSCNSIYVGNSIHGIFDAISEAASLTKHGAGLGINLSDVNGISSVVDWAKFFDEVAERVSQGKSRRGAIALYLDIEHKDIEHFLNAKELLEGDPREKLTCNIAVMIRDTFMTRLYNGDPDAKRIFAKVLELGMKYGSPYIQFVDNVWEQDPECYKARGMRSGSSNLCLTGDTKVVTQEGISPIKELVGKEVTIYDGEDWVKNNSFFYRGKSKVLRVHLKNGQHIDMTPDHRAVRYKNKRTSDRVTEVVLAKDLKIGQKLAEANEESKYLHYRRSTEWNRIVNIEELEGEHDVYCTKVPSTGMFALANGILTGNCNEIFQYHDEEHTYSCILSSLNLAKYREWRDYLFQGDITLPELAIYFLDAVNEEYIQRGQLKRGLKKATDAARKGRALGLGTLGLHSLYMSEMLPWGSPEAYELNIEVHKFIAEESLKASQYLALVLGEPEWCKGQGVRNTHRTAIAPTTTNSVLCNGGSPGIEPIIANYFSMAGAKGTFSRQNPYLRRLLQEKGLDTGHVWKSIREKGGSVQHLVGLTEHEKDVFKHAFEIDPEHLVRQAGDRQKYLCQGQSFNLFLRHDEDAQTIFDLHLLAHQQGLKGRYYIRSESQMNSKEKDKIDYVYMRTRPDCPYCMKAKELLDSCEIPYRVDLKPEGRVPEIWIDGDMLDDGYASLVKLLQIDHDLPEMFKSDCLACEG